MKKEKVQSMFWNNANYKELRRALANGERPARCDVCWHNEDPELLVIDYNGKKITGIHLLI